MQRAPRISLILAAATVLALTTASCAPVLYSDGRAQTYLGFSIGVTNAPPPRMEFYGPPRTTVVSYGVRVIEAPDPSCDLFEYGGRYYLYSAGYWYSSSRYDGSYTTIEVRQVPQVVLEVPDEHWRHKPHDHGRRNHGRGNGNGNGNRG